MLYGFPAGPPASATNVWAFKANGVENTGYLSVGPSVNWTPSSHTKTNLMNQLFGDVAHAGVVWAVISDPDMVDHPIWDPFG